MRGLVIDVTLPIPILKRLKDLFGAGFVIGGCGVGMMSSIKQDGGRMSDRLIDDLVKKVIQHKMNGGGRMIPCSRCGHLIDFEERDVRRRPFEHDCKIGRGDE